MSTPSIESTRTLAVDLPGATPGTQVHLQGQLHRRRDLAAVTFLILRDRSGLAQIVLDPNAAQTVTAREESFLDVVGTATANPQAPGGVELTAPRVRVLAEPEHSPVVELWRPALNASLPLLMDHAPVLWRHPQQRHLWQVAAAALRGFRSSLDRRGFTEIQTPKIIPHATESGSNVFTLDYFGTPAYLAQSPQFYKQQLVGVFERVYETGPVFRAEPSDTARHLAEYVSLDAELGPIADHRDVLDVVRQVLAGMIGAVAQVPGGAGFDLPQVPEQIPVVHFADALQIAGADPGEPDLAPADERALGQWALAEHGSDFLAVEGYPMRKRPFYTHPQPDDERYSNSFDVLFRGLEIVTGGQRLHRYGDYVAAIEARREQVADYADYLQAFSAGMPPHGGFAIGLERFTARLVGAENVRQVRPYPRDLNRLSP